jgi:hypothetical protein
MFCGGVAAPAGTGWPGGWRMTLFVKAGGGDAAGPPGAGISLRLWLQVSGFFPHMTRVWVWVSGLGLGFLGLLPGFRFRFGVQVSVLG